MTRFRTLAAIFSPTYRSASADRAVLRRGGVLGPTVEVAPRADCAYRRFEFGHLPPRQRAGAARLAVGRHEPVAGAPVHVAWTGGVAHAWWWLEAPPMPAAGHPSWLPETLLRPPVAGDAARLLAMVRGFEGQYWQQGVLRASQWWPAVPGQDSWGRFLRACGAPQGPVPDPLQLPLASRPWGDRARIGGWSPARAETLAWRSVALLGAFLLAWQLTGLLHWQAAATRAQERLEEFRAKASPLLDAREQAEAARAELERLALLQQGVDDQRLMVEVARRLPEGDALSAWQREGARLQFSVATAVTDPRIYVAALEGMPGVLEVQASPDGGGMRVQVVLETAAAAASDGEAAST
jgi:hypothetical protein